MRNVPKQSVVTRYFNHLLVVLFIYTARGILLQGVQGGSIGACGGRTACVEYTEGEGL